MQTAEATTGRHELNVRSITAADVDETERIVRGAFATFAGVPDLFGDRDFVRGRLAAHPDRAIGIALDGELVAANIITRWGSLGLFGPLAVRAGLWDRGIASALLEATIDLFDMWAVRQAGLFTFASSPKHLWLYQKFGFWPRFLTPILARPVLADVSPAPFLRYGDLAPSERGAARRSVAEITTSIYDGLDVGDELEAVVEQGRGDVVLLDDGAGIGAFAVCHVGAGSEGGSGRVYVKVAAVRPGTGAPAMFERLIAACVTFATQHGASEIEAGVSSGRREAYAALAGAGFRPGLIGVQMLRPNESATDRAGVFMIDDWR